MAENPGKDTPATDPKSPVGKAGPVKPPVLEGTARPSGATPSSASTSTQQPGSKPAEMPGEKPSTSTATTRPTTATTARPRDTEEAGGSGAAWLAGIVGGLVGLGAAYGLAWFGLWPAPASAPLPADPRLAQFATTIPELETTTSAVQGDLSALVSRVAALETAEPPAAAATADPALAQTVADLSARLDAISATSGSGGDSTAAMEAVQVELASLQAEFAAANAQVAETQQQLAALTQATDATADTSAATLRLPLVFSGLEAAFASGRAYEAELAALRGALPQASVPDPIVLQAGNGLPRPDAVAVELTAALPAMLAGRPVDANANWQDATIDWFRGLVAMRPAGEVEGDGADAIIARLEAAVARRDFIAAEAELNALPAPMRAAAGAVAEDIASLAAAQAFLGQLRAQALNGENGA